MTEERLREIVAEETHKALGHVYGRFAHTDDSECKNATDAFWREGQRFATCGLCGKPMQFIAMIKGVTE